MIKMLQYKMYPAGELRCPTTARYYYVRHYNVYTRISSENVHLMYYHTVIVENTQVQYFDNLISNCTRVFSMMPILIDCVGV